jgi:hypothetical protein
LIFRQERTFATGPGKPPESPKKSRRAPSISEIPKEKKAGIQQTPAK